MATATTISTITVIPRNVISATNYIFNDSVSNLEKVSSFAKNLFAMIALTCKNSVEKASKISSICGDFSKSLKLFSFISSTAYFSSNVKKDVAGGKFSNIMKMTMVLGKDILSTVSWIQSKLELIHLGDKLNGILHNSLSFFGTGILFSKIACFIDDIKDLKTIKEESKNKIGCVILEGASLVCSIASTILGSFCGVYVSAGIALVSSTIGIVQMLYKEKNQKEWMISSAAA